MSKTDHARKARRSDDVTRIRQPRPALRRQGTRAGVIRAALQEA